VYSLAPSVPITLRQNRRIHHTVDGTQTFFRMCDTLSAWMCTRGYETRYIHTADEHSRSVTGTRAAPALQDIPGRLQGRSCGISRDTDVTSKVTRCLDTFRNMRGKISFLTISFGCRDGTILVPLLHAI